MMTSAEHNSDRYRSRRKTPCYSMITVNADPWNNKNAFETSRYWLEKLSLLIDPCQDGIVLSGKVWFDETQEK